jgi:hypothetical protein
MSVDPLADKSPSLTPYQYVRNNPLIRIDPDGQADILKYLQTLFDVSSESYVGESRSRTQVERIQNAASDVASDIDRSINDALEPAQEFADATIEGAREGTIATTAVVAPVADKTATGLGLIAPFSGPAAPEVAAAALSFKAIAVSSKVVNVALGGDDFTTGDIAGDVIGTGLSVAIPGANGLTGTLVGESVDRLIEDLEEERDE